MDLYDIAVARKLSGGGGGGGSSDFKKVTVESMAVSSSITFTLDITALEAYTDTQTHYFQLSEEQAQTIPYFSTETMFVELDKYEVQGSYSFKYGFGYGGGAEIFGGTMSGSDKVTLVLV